MKKQYINAEDLPIAALSLRQFKQLMKTLLEGNPGKENTFDKDDDELLTFREAKALLKCSRSALFSYLKQGIVRREKLAGKLLFRKSSLLSSVKAKSIKKDK